MKKIRLVSNCKFLGEILCKYIALFLMDMLDCSLKNLQLVGTAVCVYRTQINTFILFNFKLK